MKCKMLSFVGYILLFSFHCASSQPHHQALNDVSGSGNLIKDSYSKYSITNSARRTNRKNFNANSLPWGYTQFSGCDTDFNTAYKFYPIKKSWVDAMWICYSEGGYLAYPDCEKEERIYHNTLTFLFSEGAWLGMSDRVEEGNWITMHYEKVNDLPYVHWALNEPNNYGPDGENCAELNFDGLWYDMTCDKKLFFICKIDL